MEPLINLRLCHRVQGSRWLIQHHKRGVLIQCPGDGDLLGLPAGHQDTRLIQIPIQPGIHPPAKHPCPVPKSRLLQTLPGPPRIILPSPGNILPQRQGKQLKILEHNGKQPSVILIPVLAHVNAVQQDLPLRRVVQSAQKLDKRGLARTVHPHHSQPAPHGKLHIHMAKHILLCPRIPKRDIPKLHLILPVAALLRRQAPPVHGIGNVQKFIGPLQKAAVASHAPKDIHQIGNPQKQIAAGPGVLGNPASPVSSGPGLQAHNPVHRSRQHRRTPLRAGQPQAPRPSGIPAHGRRRAKRMIAAHIDAAHPLLLAVHPQVHGPLSVPAQGHIKNRQAVAQPIFGRKPGPILLPPARAQGRTCRNPYDSPKQKNRPQGMIHPGQATPSPGNLCPKHRSRQ